MKTVSAQRSPQEGSDMSRKFRMFSGMQATPEQTRLPEEHMGRPPELGWRGPGPFWGRTTELGLSLHFRQKW